MLCSLLAISMEPINTHTDPENVIMGMIMGVSPGTRHWSHYNPGYSNVEAMGSMGDVAGREGERESGL